MNSLINDRMVTSAESSALSNKNPFNKSNSDKHTMHILFMNACQTEATRTMVGQLQLTNTDTVII